ncbi:hypothetical protein RUM43_007061 [Polyplax serrata]|uniref:WD repeat-containing protein 20 n=1 Tax=Polyplax serrata TaxID=468196 RepID=A0AAN8S7M2_POLSC
MAVQNDGGKKDELKTQFITREGTYRLVTNSDYLRPNRVGYTNNQGNSSVRVSFVNLPDPSGNVDNICFNIGRELYVYVYKGVKKRYPTADLPKPIDKKLYKGINPTCHDFNSITATADSASLLVGFSTGQIQLVDPIKKELSKLYNEERLIDKTKVTCIKWVPGSQNLFVVSHSSGQLYLYNEDLPCVMTPPHYQPFKNGEGFTVHTCKTKSTRNPLYRWVIGQDGCCINEFAFSPCGVHLAVVSQDGFLRVFQYDKMELEGIARSYFGGFLCVCWSPDGRYVVVGGEDDLVTVWSFHERRVVARGQGHRSWVSVVAFDPYTTSYGDQDAMDFSGGSEDESQSQSLHNHIRNFNYSVGNTRNRNYSGSEVNRLSAATCYRLGSVGQDTQLCFWDITEDVLRQPVCPKQRTSIFSSCAGDPGIISGNGSASKHNASSSVKCNNIASNKDTNSDVPNINHSNTSLTQRLAGFGFGDRKEGSSLHKRNLSQSSKNISTGSDKNSWKGGGSTGSGGGGGGLSSRSCYDDPIKLIGTNACPRFDECPVLEPLMCKKIAHERLSALIFREDCFVTACQDGYIYTWARPGKMGIPSLIASSPTNVTAVVGQGIDRGPGSTVV